MDLLERNHRASAVHENCLVRRICPNRNLCTDRCPSSFSRPFPREAKFIGTTDISFHSDERRLLLRILFRCSALLPDPLHTVVSEIPGASRHHAGRITPHCRFRNNALHYYQTGSTLSFPKSREHHAINTGSGSTNSVETLSSVTI